MTTGALPLGGGVPVFACKTGNISIKNTDHHGIIKIYADRDGALDE